MKHRPAKLAVCDSSNRSLMNRRPTKLAVCDSSNKILTRHKPTKLAVCDSSNKSLTHHRPTKLAVCDSSNKSLMNHRPTILAVPLPTNRRTNERTNEPTNQPTNQPVVELESYMWLQEPAEFRARPIAWDQLQCSFAHRGLKINILKIAERWEFSMHLDKRRRLLNCYRSCNRCYWSSE
jgi:hypothetical protein